MTTPTADDIEKRIDAAVYSILQMCQCDPEDEKKTKEIKIYLLHFTSSLLEDL